MHPVKKRNEQQEKKKEKGKEALLLSCVGKAVRMPAPSGLDADDTTGQECPPPI